ncbi:glycosyltransferase family 2 protein [Algoriphagus sp. AGSA1]|uniref:glycosyltransferase family 2 protein n=1 Tax=Algoriphagus sp. AGSA1 TaxID=2907213 RepID=UPI001F43C0CE|nr:glycosyltransferase family 2 protein [Algoriphagus sp. AGSA1]MCE7053744.1 glycosyltransferase family 2 protein [Algoriphagus sp. AGSA1]
MELTVLLLILLILYTYIGYGGVVFLLVKLKPKGDFAYQNQYFPSVSLIIPYYNEKAGLQFKIDNTLQLDYPVDKLEIIFVSDGSDDGSDDILKGNYSIKSIRVPKRGGKFAAMKKAVAESNGSILVFSDANTLLNQSAIKELIRPYQDSKVGAVTGEKRIITLQSEGASSKGEGVYWKYESFLKRLDSYFYTQVGGDGGLMSYRRELFEDLPDDTILDDFMLSMRVAENGYLVKYAPMAEALEYSSSSVREEIKRKIRIAAGGWQSIFRLSKAINPFYDFRLFFQYVSHRVLRWTVCPFLLPVIFLLNHFLVGISQNRLWDVLLVAQYLFYALALLGYWARDKAIPIVGFFIPYYFSVMNYCAIRGFFRWLTGGQAVTWQRAERANEKGLG